jgi:hypothetical protein
MGWTQGLKWGFDFNLPLMPVFKTPTAWWSSPNSNTYFNMLRHHEFMNPVDMEYNLFSSLFQIYAALYSLRNIMTHQDLHLKNVMIVTLPQKVNIVYTIDEREYVLITK